MTTATAERRTEAVCLRDPAPCLPRLQWLTPSQIRTSFAALRRGRLGAPRPGDVQAELPLRVFETMARVLAATATPRPGAQKYVPSPGRLPAR